LRDIKSQTRTPIVIIGRLPRPGRHRLRGGGPVLAAVAGGRHFLSLSMAWPA